jgi:hypothetical protein
MSDNEKLPQELLWAAGGHASDVVLTALADGQAEIVPDDVRAHVDRCTVCTAHLGHAALLSLYTNEEIAILRVPEKRPLPRLAIGLGLLVAALGALPRLIESDAPSLRDVPLFVKGLHTLALKLDEPGSARGLFVTYGTALFLFGMALIVVRFLPKKETPR